MKQIFATNADEPAESNDTADSVLSRTLRLMEAVAKAHRPLPATELAAQINIPKSTAHRLLQKLEAEGFVVKEPGGRHFVAGTRLFQLSLDVMRHGVGADRRATLENLVARIGETCNFTALAGHEVIYLDRVEARWPLRLNLEPGSRVPLHCTASGKLLLASMDRARRDKILSLSAFEAMTPATITDPRVLAGELEDISQNGYSIDREEFLTGLIAIAVPVRDQTGNVVAAIACHAPVARMTLESAISYLPLLLEAARKLTGTFQS